MDFHYSFDGNFFGSDFPIEEFAEIFAIVIIVSLVIGLLFGLAAYIMHAIAVHHIAKRRKLAAPWLAWIPVARLWTLGAIADEFDKRSSGHDRRFRIFYLVLSVLMILCFVGVASAAVSAIEILSSVNLRDMEDVFGAVMAIFGASSGLSSYITYIYLLLICLESIIIFKIYDSLSPKLALIFTLLYVVVPLFAPISLLCLKNKGYPEAEAAPEIPEAVRLGWYNQD